MYAWMEREHAQIFRVLKHLAYKKKLDLFYKFTISPKFY